MSRRRRSATLARAVRARALCRTAVLVRHGYLLLFKGLARWRLETFGLYMPSLPSARPWWRVDGHALCQLFRQRGAYARWIWEMHELQMHGETGWWRERLGVDYHALELYIDMENDSADRDDTR